MSKITEKCYYFSNWTIPIVDFKEFFQNDYVESEDELYIDIKVAGQEVNGNTYNIYWKSLEYDNIKGEVKFINWKSAFAMCSNNWTFEDDEEEEPNIEDLEYIEVPIPVARLPKTNIDKLKEEEEEKEKGYDSDTDKSSSDEEVRKVLGGYKNDRYKNINSTQFVKKI